MKSTEDFVADLVALDRARFPLLWILTGEERRTLVSLQSVAHQRGAVFYVWSFTMGWVDHDGNAAPIGGEDRNRRDPFGALDTVYESQVFKAVRSIRSEGGETSRALFVLKDFDPFLEDAGVVRRLRDCEIALRARQQSVVILSPRLVLPPHLAKAVHVVDFPLPDRTTLEALVDGAVATAREPLAARGIDPTPDTVTRQEVLRLLSGLSFDEAENIVAKSLVVKHALDPALIANEKKVAIRKTEVLEIVSTSDRLADVGGHDRLKAWLQEAQLAFSDDAKAFGVEPVRGALFVGVPGTAKSLVVKATANDWRLPIVRVDIGRLMGSLVGESESRARQMTQILEANAPAIGWIDEIEKGIGGVASSAHSDAGTTARVFGHLLTFMQEATAPVVIFATANDITLLPPELLRRFDAVWFFDVPRHDERRQIWSIHLGKRGRDPDAFDLDGLAEQSEKYTGHEIEKAVKQALRRAYLDGKREVTERDLIDILRFAEPLAVSHAERIEGARKALGGLAQPTSDPHPHPAMNQVAAVRKLDLG